MPASSLLGKAELAHITLHWAVLLDSTEGQINKEAYSMLEGDKCMEKSIPC